MITKEVGMDLSLEIGWNHTSNEFTTNILLIRRQIHHVVMILRRIILNGHRVYVLKCYFSSSPHTRHV